MSIDGIGKPGPANVPSLDEAGGASGAEPTSTERVEVGKTEPAAETSGSEALQALERGEISVDEYLDARIADAVAHLKGQIPAPELEFVQETLREQLRNDPVLVELVRRATGALPDDSR
jgi:hypothetical protein